MRFLLADEHLIVAGRCFAGFPLLLNDECNSLEPAQEFLWDLLGNSGRIESKATWREYGRAMYDFFAFVEKNQLDWKAMARHRHPTAISAYRDWSRGIVGLASASLNQRLRIIVRFYKWAYKRGYICELPFEFVAVNIRKPQGLLAHLDTLKGETITPEVLLKEKSREVKFLVLEQVEICFTHLSNETHQLMFNLMVRTGLRQIECRTFPEKYVFDPSRRRDLQKGQKIRVFLHATDMKLKSGKSRSIDIPYELMEDLWWYCARHRQRRELRNAENKKYASLFLTEAGVPYGDTAFTQIFLSLSKRVGFSVHPHMLRHTYATYLLWSLRKSPNFLGEPLLYVRDRMGHSDVSTTAIYLHLINSLEGHLILAHEDEMEVLFAEKRGACAKTEKV